MLEIQKFAKKLPSNLWKALLVLIQMGINMATGNLRKHWPLSFSTKA